MEALAGIGIVLATWLVVIFSEGLAVAYGGDPRAWGCILLWVLAVALAGRLWLSDEATRKR